jgi:transcriptional regulator with XRE-family HTH domain
MLRELGRREINLLRLYIRCTFGMTPQAFHAKWDVTHEQMAQICGCSVPTVNRWFAGDRHYHAPSATHLRRLAEMDLLWESYEDIPPAFRQTICRPRG